MAKVVANNCVYYGSFYVTQTVKMAYWKKWFQMIAEEGWTAYDRTARELYPHWEGAHLAVALDAKDDHFLGCFVWCENDGIAGMDAYNVIREAQCRGVGAALWDYTMNRSVPKHLTKAMRSLPERVDRYMRLGWPCKGPIQYQIQCSTLQFQKACTSLLAPLQCTSCNKSTFLPIRSLSNDQHEKLFEFDKKVTGRDRRKLWEKLLKFGHINGGVMLDSNEKVIALCLILETFGDRVLRVAPLYGENLQAAILTLLNSLKTLNDSTNSKCFHIHFTESTTGFYTLLPAIEAAGVSRDLYAVTLYDRLYQNPMNTDLVYLIHDNFLHFDM